MRVAKIVVVISCDKSIWLKKNCYMQLSQSLG